MIEVKGSLKFIDFYREDKIDDKQTQYIPKTTEIREVIMNCIRFTCPVPVIFISELMDKLDEHTVIIKSNEVPLTDWVNSELCFKFNKNDTVVILCDIDIDNRLIISISTLY